MVSVDGLPALCTGLACDFTYVAGESEINGFSISNDKYLTISGVNFGEPLKIEMANLDCSNIVVALTRDAITCELSDPLPAGSWYPIVIEDFGKVKIADPVAPYVVTISITNVSPKSLNPAGGDIVTIEGTNFPLTLDPRYELVINLGSNTKCVAFAISAEQILCETEPFT